MNEYLMIGEVLKPQGVRGEVKIKPYAADLEAFHDWKTLYLLDGTVYQPIKASCSRVHDGFAYVTLGDCKTMDWRSCAGRSSTSTAHTPFPSRTTRCTSAT